jgi:hypothetical protein
MPSIGKTHRLANFLQNKLHLPTTAFKHPRRPKCSPFLVELTAALDCPIQQSHSRPPSHVTQAQKKPPLFSSPLSSPEALDDTDEMTDERWQARKSAE